MPSISQNRGELVVYIRGGEDLTCSYLPRGAVYHYLKDPGNLSKLSITPQDRVIIHFNDAALRKAVFENIRQISPVVPVLVVDPTEEEAGKKSSNEDSCLSVISVGSILKSKSQERWHQIETKKRIKKMKEVIDPDKPILILTQDDPDPDAIASAMALQVVLERNDKTAPIVTLRGISRNENVNMINILGTVVKKVSMATVRDSPQIAMVDVQPSFFKKSFSNLKIVIDHHPVSLETKIAYKDLQVTYGATSTILTEYLIANNSVIHQKLATALYYGIKTDTLALGREVSKADFHAFVQLWPKTNHEQISQMEKPRLKDEEIDVYITALKKHTVTNGFLFAALGNVPKDDLVPRLADFVLQIGKTDFAVVWGIIGKSSTFSARSQAPTAHAGEILKELFDSIGSAGGHQSMARATVDTSILMKEFKAKSIKSLSEILQKKLLTVIKKNKKTSKQVNQRK